MQQLGVILYKDFLLSGMMMLPFNGAYILCHCVVHATFPALSVASPMNTAANSCLKTRANITSLEICNGSFMKSISVACSFQHAMQCMTVWFIMSILWKAGAAAASVHARYNRAALHELYALQADCRKVYGLLGGKLHAAARQQYKRSP